MAERLVEQAGARGVPVTVYRLRTIRATPRPARGTPTRSHAACSRAASRWEFSRRAGTRADHLDAGRLRGARPGAPVAATGDLTERFHLVNPATVPVGTVLGWVGELGHPVALRPRTRRGGRRCETLARGRRAPAGGPRASFPEDRRRAGHGRPGLRASDGGGARGHPCRAVDAALVGRYVARTCAQPGCCPRRRCRHDGTRAAMTHDGLGERLAVAERIVRESRRCGSAPKPRALREARVHRYV